MPDTIIKALEFENWFEAEDREEIDYMMQPGNEDWIKVRLDER